MENMRTLCKEIGNNYGKYFEENNRLCIDNGEKIFRYDTEKELLVDWVDTLIEETLADGFNWNNEIEFIVLNYNHKIKGVRVYNGKNKTTYMATIDIPKENGKTKQLSCGSFSTIIEAIKTRKEAEKNRDRGENIMKYVCKNDFKINGILVGNKGDVLEITNAIPRENENETLEDVVGYCDILNTTKNRFFEATWLNVEENEDVISRV